jgi:G:T-mismatch repair DNA endonuclease (very short patch repair protein)
MVTIDPSGDPDLQALSDVLEGKTVESEQEYRDFVSNHDPPDGYVWTRSPFGPGGKWTVNLAKEANHRITNTDLERRIRSLLKNWGYWDAFEQDYRLSDGKQIDFADTTRKVALEPGAAYWHTPDGFSGEIVSNVGEHPEEVYFPPTESDLRKQKRLTESGWKVLWISEDGVKDHPLEIRTWLDDLYPASL